MDIEVSIEHVGLSHKWLVQAKRYSGNVGVKEVREYCSLKYREYVDGVIIVTTSSFTKEAHEEASKHNVKLIEGTLLVTMLNRYCPDQCASVDSVQRTELSVSGESVLGRQPVMFEGLKIIMSATPEHIYFEKPSGSLFSRKPELLRRIKVKDIVGFQQISKDVFLVLGGNNLEIVRLIPVKSEDFYSILENLRPTYLRGETLLKLEKSANEFVVLTSHRFAVIRKSSDLSFSLNLKAIAGCEEEKSGAFRRKKLVLLEAEDGITRHEVDVKDVSGWLGLVKDALQRR